MNQETQDAAPLEPKSPPTARNAANLNLGMSAPFLLSRVMSFFRIFLFIQFLERKRFWCACACVSAVCVVKATQMFWNFCIALPVLSCASHVITLLLDHTLAHVEHLISAPKSSEIATCNELHVVHWYHKMVLPRTLVNEGRGNENSCLPNNLPVIIPFYLLLHKRKHRVALLGLLEETRFLFLKRIIPCMWGFLMNIARTKTSGFYCSFVCGDGLRKQLREPGHTKRCQIYRRILIVRRITIASLLHPDK